MAEEKKSVICQDEELGKALLQSFHAFCDALAEQLKKQKEQGFPVDEALKNVRKAKRYVARLVR